MKGIACGNKWLNLEKPVVMGILNLTPDSFYDGGKFPDLNDALIQTEKMVLEGASIIDIGGMSTRPGADLPDETMEWSRVSGVLKVIRERFPDLIISVDTFRSSVAKMATDKGADIINDISGGQFDQRMFETVIKAGVGYIIMHIQGTPATMQLNPSYTDIVGEIKSFFARQLMKMETLGGGKNIILDPGFGFGKAVDHNYQLLSSLRSFTEPGYPLMVGLSRKSMISKVLGIKPGDALNGTTVLNTLALLNGADILRVHDVKEAIEVISLVEWYKNSAGQ